MKTARQKSARPEASAKAAKPAANAAKTGRASTYSFDRVAPFLDLIGEAKSTREAAQAIGVSKSTIFAWLDRHKEFADLYARAKEAAADFIVEQMLEIADDARNDFIENDKGHVTLDTEAVARSRLRIDTRKWLAGKLKPKKYGDNVDLNHGVQSDNPLADLLKRIQGNAMPIRQETFEPSEA
jgi:hypothetical protein